MIWCDLDNTQIWMWEPVITTPLLSRIYGMPIEGKPRRQKGRTNPIFLEVPGFGCGYACSRKRSRQFLRRLRRLAAVKMLTSAARPYAEVMNARFGFGFTPVEIVSREEIRHPANKAIDPGAILVDNESQFQSDHNHRSSRQQKLAYLGITRDRVVEVSYFDGGTADLFDLEWSGHVAAVRDLLNKTQHR